MQLFFLMKALIWTLVKCDTYWIKLNDQLLNDAKSNENNVQHLQCMNENTADTTEDCLKQHLPLYQATDLNIHNIFSS